MTITVVSAPWRRVLGCPKTLNMTTLPQRSAKKPRTLRASNPLASCLDVVAAEAPSSALWMTLRASPQASMAELLQRFTLAIKEHEATLVHTTLFGAVPAAIAATGPCDRPSAALTGP